MIFFYYLILFLLAIYSYSLVDLNFTLINSDIWETFRSLVIQIGYFRRDISWYIFLGLILSLFIFHFKITASFRKFDPLKLSFIIGGILLLSYPFLSHDFFNYMFDARIVTFYHQNPYLRSAYDFDKFGDTWLRFMQWTHRAYPYGPTWLPLTLIPSFISFGKLILNFVFFKLFFIIFYFLAVFYLNKMDRRSAIFFATHPLVILEGVISPHNDFIAVAFGIVGIYYLVKRKDFISRIILIISSGIKYVTLPLVFLSHDKNSKRNMLLFFIQIAVILAVSYQLEIQPWYFLILFSFLPYYQKFIERLNIFFAGLIFSYYPYIRLGGWDTPDKIALKHNIIIVFFILNIFYLLYIYKINNLIIRRKWM